MEEKIRRAPAGSDDTSKRVDALESGLQNVRSRLDGLERSSRAIEGDVRTMKDQINSMQSSIQEMLMIFRNLSEKIRQQATGGRQMEAAAGGRQQAEARGGGRKWTGDELVKDPRHRREDEDEGA